MNPISKRTWKQHVLRVRLPEGEPGILEIDRDSFIQESLAVQSAEDLLAFLRVDHFAHPDTPAPKWAHAILEGLADSIIDPRDCTVQVWRHEPTITLHDAISGEDRVVPNPDATHGYVLVWEKPVARASAAAQLPRTVTECVEV